MEDLNKFLKANWFYLLCCIIYGSLFFAYCDYLFSEEYKEDTKKLPRQCKVLEGFVKGKKHFVIMEIDSIVYQDEVTEHDYLNEMRHKGELKTMYYSKINLDNLAGKTTKLRFYAWLTIIIPIFVGVCFIIDRSLNDNKRGEPFIFALICFTIALLSVIITAIA